MLIQANYLSGMVNKGNVETLDQINRINSNSVKYDKSLKIANTINRDATNLTTTQS